MKREYSFARSGNGTWAQLWVDHATSFPAVSPQQLAYSNRLLKKARQKCCIT